MEESFDNIIKQFPKLKQKELTGTKAVVNFNNFDDDNNKKPIKPNTYGMHLEGDHGYIWNVSVDFLSYCCIPHIAEWAGGTWKTSVKTLH